MSALPLTFLVLSTWLFFFILIPVLPVHGTDPVYSPQTISDVSGNTADNTSTVTWASLPTGDDFAASSPSRVSEGLKAYYDFMHNFINSVFMNGIPEEIIENGIDGDFDAIVSNYQSYINYFIGFGICVVIGVLFFFIFPIVACCFCCCRLCGNCGGKREQSQKDADNVCKKYTFVSILFVSIVFVTVGTICIYINNDNMTTTLNNIPDTAEDNLNDVRTFVNNTVKQAEHIVTDNFQFVQTALFRDLDNIEYLVGLPLKTDIEDNTNISNVLSSAYALTNSIDGADAALSAVESNKTAMETAVTGLTTALTAVTDALDTIFTDCGTVVCPTADRPDYSGAVPDIDTSAFPDLSSARTSMDSAKGTNLTAKIQDAEAEVDDIPSRVGRDSNSTRESMKTTISDLSDDLEDIVDQVTDVNNKISGENATVDLDKYIADIKDLKEQLETYDKYRWYGGVGLSTICLLVIVFTVLGLAFGVCGASSKTPPYERGCISNCGGIMLMVAASLIFIFSTWLMFLTFITFIPGAPIHKVFCEPVTNLEKLEEYLTIYNDKEVGAGNYFLADMVLDNKTIPLTVTGALQDCKDGQGVFTAFKLDNKFDLTDMLNYSKTLDVQAEIDSVNVNLSSVQIYSTSLQTQLSDLQDAVNISFTEFYTELGANVTTANLSSLADEIDTYAATPGLTASIASRLSIEATNLRNIETEEYAYVESNRTALNTSVAEMDAAVSNIPTLVDDLDTALQNADSYVQTNGSTAVRSILNTYVTRLLSIVDSYVAFTDDAVKNQLGSCEPVWNIYNTLLVYTFCYNFMDCFNGFWFSLGWVIFFFMPSVIFAVKLAKYFRCTEYPDDELLDSEHPPPYSTNNEKNPNTLSGQEAASPDMPSRAKFWMKNNKVAHHDTDDCNCATAPSLSSKESHDYLDQVPPNLYHDNSYTDPDTTDSTAQLIAVVPGTSNNVDTNPLKEDGITSQKCINNGIERLSDNDIKGDDDNKTQVKSETPVHVDNSVVTTDDKVPTPNEDQEAAITMGNCMGTSNTVLDGEPLVSTSVDLEKDFHTNSNTEMSHLKTRDEVTALATTPEEAIHLEIHSQMSSLSDKDANQDASSHNVSEQDQESPTDSEKLTGIEVLGPEGEQQAYAENVKETHQDSNSSVGKWLPSTEDKENQTKMTPVD